MSFVWRFRAERLPSNTTHYYKSANTIWTAMLSGVDDAWRSTAPPSRVGCPTDDKHRVVNASSLRIEYKFEYKRPLTKKDIYNRCKVPGACTTRSHDSTERHNFFNWASCREISVPCVHNPATGSISGGSFVTLSAVC